MTEERAHLKPDLLIIGQFPPPVHGFAQITRWLADAVKQSNGHLIELDLVGSRKASGPLRHAARLTATLRAMRTIKATARAATPPICYVACEGGLGLIYTWLIVRAARRAGLRTLLHHHSFAYIDSNSPHMRRVLGANPAIEHIFLCRTMRARFSEVYGVGHDDHVLSNAAFVNPGATPETTEPLTAAAPVIGLLSNLNREKGLYAFLETLEAAASSGLPLRGILAGPVALAEDRAALEKAQAALGERLDYRGPLYGADKDRFYRDIDIFAFPTIYNNEAQPTVLFEALATGCAVISLDRGCIRDQVGEDGAVFDRDADFAKAAIAWLQTRPPIDASSRANRIVRYAERHHRARAVIGDLFHTNRKP